MKCVSSLSLHHHLLDKNSPARSPGRKRVSLPAQRHCGENGSQGFVRWRSPTTDADSPSLAFFSGKKRALGQPETPAPPGDSLPPGGFTGDLETRHPPRCSGARESEYETRKVRPKLPTCGQPVKPFSSRALRGFSQYEIPLAGPWPAPPSTAVSTPTPDRVPRAAGRRSPPGSAGMGSLPGRRGALSATSAAAPILGRCSGAEAGNHRGPGRLANPSERPEASPRRWKEKLPLVLIQTRELVLGNAGLFPHQPPLPTGREQGRGAQGVRESNTGKCVCISAGPTNCTKDCSRAAGGAGRGPRAAGPRGTPSASCRNSAKCGRG